MGLIDVTLGAEYTADQLTRMADAYRRMARVFTSKPADQEYCELMSERCLAAARYAVEAA